MRKVINTPPTDTVNIGLVSDRHYYGVQLSTRRGFITRQTALPTVMAKGLRPNWKIKQRLCPLDDALGDYALRSINALTSGNGWEQYNHQSLKGMIENFFGHNFDVFEFDGFRELAIWLLDDPNYDHIENLNK